MTDTALEWVGMGYHHVIVDDIEPADGRPSTVRSISKAAGLDTIGAHVYEVDPGEQIPLAYHYHEQQEELFYVLSGTLHVETEDGEFVVDADEAFVAEPESPHRAFVPDSASESVRALVVGAPSVRDTHRLDEE